MIKKAKTEFYIICDSRRHKDLPATYVDKESKTTLEAAKRLELLGWDVRNGKTICPKCKEKGN